MSSEKFGLEIEALTEARIMAEKESYSARSRSNYETAMEKNAALIDRVSAFLEKNGADAVSGCDYSSLFGIITTDEDPHAPCGVTFYGPPDLAQKLANVFSGAGQRVISAADGKVIEPNVATVPNQAQPPRTAQRPKF